MTYAASEMGALCRKATRGAGYTWGIAEEVDLAVRWLCAHGLPGAESAEIWLKGRNVTSNGDACPITTGIRMSDRGFQLNGDVWTSSHLVAPLLSLPFLAFMEIPGIGVLQVNVAGLEYFLDLEGRLYGQPDPEPVTHGIVVVRNCDVPSGPLLMTDFRANPPSDVVASLNLRAALTYAPSTEQSRSSGAGAGTADND